jgi:WS/DGAT/MGAT family acyltransferase
MAKKPFSNADKAWMRMEDPTNLMMITGVLVFGAPIDYERLRATLEHRLMRHDRFRSRVGKPLLPNSRPYWKGDPEFDMAYHLQRLVLPPPGDQAALQEVVSLLASTQLDPSKPLWQLHLIEDYGDGCAVICRLHHSIGDGVALVHVLLSLTDTEADAPWPMVEPELPQRRRRSGPGAWLRPAHSLFRNTGRATRAIWHQGRETVTHPSRVFTLAQFGAGGAVALGKLVLRWPDPKTVFKGELGIPKRAAWSAPIPLQDVKTVGKGLGGTVNDVLLTAMTGGLRRYLQERGERVRDLNIRAIVPVNLRPPGKEFELGNMFGLVFLSLPVGLAEPIDRLYELRRRMDGLKGSLEAPVAFGIVNAIGASPAPVQDLVVDIFGTKGTAVMTNVMGPKVKLCLAGAPLEALMFWVPQSGRLGMGVSILSYDDQVWLGVMTDEGLVSDPEMIIAGFRAEFDELLAAAQTSEEIAEMEEMSRKLDDALAKMDALLEEKAKKASETTAQAADPEAGEAAPAATEGAPARCQALTKAGKPCRNRALANSQFCAVHQKK